MNTSVVQGKIQLSRRERARAKLSGTDPKNTFIRRSVSRVILYFLVWLGFCSGTLTASIIGILLMGGPKLLSDVWHQTESEPRLFAFGVFAILVGGGVGVFCGLKLGAYLIRRMQLLSEDAMDKML